MNANTWTPDQAATWKVTLGKFIANLRGTKQTVEERLLSWVAVYERRYATLARHYRDPVLATVRLPSKRRGIRDDGTNDGEEVPTHGDQAHAMFLRLEAEWIWAQYLARSHELGKVPFSVPAKDSSGKAIWPFTTQCPEQLLQEFARIKKGEPW